MSSNSFMVVSLGFYKYNIMSYENNDTFTFCPIWFSFISFSSVIAMVRTSKTMLNSSGKSRHPCLFPDISRNAFAFSPLRMMLAMALSYMTFIMLV